MQWLDDGGLRELQQHFLRLKDSESALLRRRDELRAQLQAGPADATQSSPTRSQQHSTLASISNALDDVAKGAAGQGAPHAELHDSDAEFTDI